MVDRKNLLDRAFPVNDECLDNQERLDDGWARIGAFGMKLVIMEGNPAVALADVYPKGDHWVWDDVAYTD